MQSLVLQSLLCVAEARDHVTGRHMRRTPALVNLLAEHLAGSERFRAELAAPRLDMIVKASALHDLGMVGIPDAVLFKPGRHTADEDCVMMTHVRIGANIIAMAMHQALSDRSDQGTELADEVCAFLRVAHDISRWHHEKWDGSGYPDALAGDAIPLSARLTAVADVFDTLTTPRVYEPPMTLNEATKIILDGRGSDFDPDVVDAFMACRDRFAEIASFQPD